MFAVVFDTVHSALTFCEAAADISRRRGIVIGYTTTEASAERISSSPQMLDVVAYALDHYSTKGIDTI